jgi:hypothetical protein
MRRGREVKVETQHKFSAAISEGNEMSLASRLDKIAATFASKQSSRQQIVRRIMGDEHPEEVLNRMVLPTVR